MVTDKVGIESATGNYRMSIELKSETSETRGMSHAISPTFLNILFATDFSPCSESAVPFVRAIADRYNATVHVVHVVAEEPVTVPVASFVDRESECGREAGLMNTLTQSDSFKDILCTQVIERGEVWDVISRMVVDRHADLVVVGTHGLRGLKRLMLGSVAGQVFRHAACPVLTVGPRVRKKGLARGRMDSILYTTDFSTSSQEALEYAVSLARSFYAELVLFHAVPFGGSWFNDDEGARRAALRELLDLVSQYPQIDYQVSVEIGAPAPLIVTAAEEIKADLIVMGANRETSVSVQHQVVCSAPCPVLTIPS